MTDRHGERWTTDEMTAAVDAYLEMLRLQNQGSDFTKADIVRQLLEGPLAGRTRKSVEFRFCNISSVLSEHSQPHVEGYLPLDHVGGKTREMIINLLSERGLDL